MQEKTRLKRLMMAENSIRPSDIGRRVSLFADTFEGANAIHYSLFETSKMHILESYAYLNAVFNAPPNTVRVEKTKALLPWSFKNSKADWQTKHIYQMLTMYL